MRPRGTTIPLLIRGLVQVGTAAIAPVQVINGPRAAQNIEPDSVLFAVTPAGSEAVSVTSAPARGLGSRPSDSFTVWNVISCYHGDADVDSLYDRAGAILDKLETAFTAPGVLKDVADDLQIGPDLTWTPAQFQQGVALEVSFAITGKVLR